MISDEAVEAAARVWISEFEPRDDPSRVPPTETEKRAIRAALEAALPHLLADTRYPVTEQKQEVSSSQGCGTGHSADAGSLPALAHYDAGLLSDYGGGNVSWWQDYIRAELAYAHDFYEAQMIANWPLDGGEAVHARPLSAASAEPKTEYVAVTEAVRLAEKQMTSLREALAARPQKGGEG